MPAIIEKAVWVARCQTPRRRSPTEDRDGPCRGRPGTADRRARREAGLHGSAGAGRSAVSGTRSAYVLAAYVASSRSSSSVEVDAALARRLAQDLGDLVPVLVRDAQPAGPTPAWARVSRHASSLGRRPSDARRQEATTRTASGRSRRAPGSPTRARRPRRCRPGPPGACRRRGRRRPRDRAEEGDRDDVPAGPRRRERHRLRAGPARGRARSREPGSSGIGAPSTSTSPEPPAPGAGC